MCGRIIRSRPDGYMWSHFDALFPGNFQVRKQCRLVSLSSVHAQAAVIIVFPVAISNSHSRYVCSRSCKLFANLAVLTSPK